MSAGARPLSVGIVGFGKIARAEHLPAIAASESFAVLCVADTAPGDGSLPHYPDVERMLSARDTPDAVVVCTPPQFRCRIARHALERGTHVLLEKPPGVTVEEVEDLERLAKQKGLVLFCAWHSQFAPGVRPAREWLAPRALRRVRIDWREDVRVWHPKQRWIWETGGFGVFDPGINALSIAVRILPEPLTLNDAVLRFPANCSTPIGAALRFADPAGADITATFEWLHTGSEQWSIEVETSDGLLLLSEGGSRLAIENDDVQLEPSAEYPAIYRHFAELIATRRSDVDLRPLRLAADALAHGRHEAAPPFLESN